MPTPFQYFISCFYGLPTYDPPVFFPNSFHYSPRGFFISGENNKTVSFIKVGKFRNDIKVDDTGDFLSGKNYSILMTMAFIVDPDYAGARKVDSWNEPSLSMDSARL